MRIDVDGKVHEFHVLAVESVPRYGPLAHSKCIFDALGPLGIPVLQVGGAFWSQVLERGMEKLISETPKPDAILVLDYDTIFTHKDVCALVGLMILHPEVGAIAPIQGHRNGQQILCTMPQTGEEMEVKLTPEQLNGDLMEVATAHFGLTLIRTSALEAMAKPWFHCKPNAEGQWRDGKIEDDIWFWDKWREAGNKFCLAMRVVVGHMVELVMWPDKRMKMMYQPMDEYCKSGQPAETWQ